MKKINICLLSLLFVTVLGCQSFTGFDFDSDAIVGGGAVAGKDYIIGLQQSQKAREYFVKSNANASQKKTVTPGNDQGTGVVWTDDGGIVIPPGCSIEFENKGYCLDPHLPAPGAGHEMQFVRIASLIPEELQGTYRNLLKRSAAGDEDLKNNMQRLVWALRTAGSQDVMATHLTDRQREILSECAEDGSFEDYVYRQELYGKIVEELKSKFVNKIKDSTSVRVGNVVYDAFDLLDPDKGKQKVEAHLQSLISMGLNLPVTQTGFNYGELENGIFTDIKGTGTLSFKAKIANSTSQPYTFYPMNYAAQVGSGGSSVGFYAAANSGMCQRATTGCIYSVDARESGVADEKCPLVHLSADLESDIKNDAICPGFFDDVIAEIKKLPDINEYEYKAFLYLDPNGKIRVTRFKKGGRDCVRSVRRREDRNVRYLGGIHTHPSGSLPDAFSDIDMKSAKSDGYPNVMYDTDTGNLNILNPDNNHHLRAQELKDDSTGKEKVNFYTGDTLYSPSTGEFNAEAFKKCKSTSQYFDGKK